MLWETYLKLAESQFYLFDIFTQLLIFKCIRCVFKKTFNTFMHQNIARFNRRHFHMYVPTHTF